MKFFLCFLLAFSPFFIYASELPPFEKIYVTQNQLVTFPDGTYYYDEMGNSTKVKTILCDSRGMYILIVRYQCPSCGRCWEKNKPDEGYECPIFHRQYGPWIWSKY